jgi:hypothetical protein
VFVDNDTRTGALAQAEVITHHARIDDLDPDRTYIYEVAHDGAAPVVGSFRTAPAGRATFRFTSFGDQGTGSATDLVSSPYGAYIVDQVERLEPLVHLHNGDLAYANLQPAGGRNATWDRFFANNMRSAAHRPWMPVLANHEVEAGNGVQGYGAYLTRFTLPPNGSATWGGRWYAFTVGAVRFVMVDANDVCYQDAGDLFVRGYSGGAQQAWLEAELRTARASGEIDWIVVVCHQLVASSSAGNGCDLGVREAFFPLFDRYGVDLVLSGHDHDYERTYPLRGTVAGSATRAPAVVDTATDVVDTTKGTVYMVLGGGGTSVPTGAFVTSPLTGHPTARVIVNPHDRDASEVEDAAWSAVRDSVSSYGFASFDVEPAAPGGATAIDVTVYRTAVPTPADPRPEPQVFETFTLRRSRTPG